MNKPTRTEAGAIPDCYSCGGTGRVVGFGRHHGTRCPCIDAPDEP